MIAKEDYKAAIKQYAKVLKKDPSNYTAIKNSILASRKMGNVKSEKKYLQMLVEHGPENEKLVAQGRLSHLSK
jgi:lipopolysaccharide biosynthesis regulator YciM